MRGSFGQVITYAAGERALLTVLVRVSGELRGLHREARQVADRVADLLADVWQDDAATWHCPPDPAAEGRCPVFSLLCLGSGPLPSAGQRESEPPSRSRRGRPPAGLPGPGTASRTRSPGRPRGRSAPSPGRRRARRRRRSSGPGRAARPSSTEMRTSRPTPSRSIDSNGETPKMPRSRYVREERALHVVAGEAPAHLGQVVGAEREELRRLGDLARGQRRPRHLDHRADEGVHLDPGLARRRPRAP